MTKIPIEELNKLMHQALLIRGMKECYIDFIVKDYIDAELEGHNTHGITKFLMIGDRTFFNSDEIEIKKINNIFFKINGKRNPGQIAAYEAAYRVSEAAKENGIGICSISNISRYARLSPYAEMIVDTGNIAIMMNNGGPACVAPYGGSDPILGTNPICLGFPGVKENYVFDFATSEKAWGNIRQAIVEKSDLPDKCFLNKSGEYTTDPYEAEAAVPFGGAKGSALCYAIELLTGAYIGAAMGPDLKDEYELGYLMIALSPETYGTLEGFKQDADNLACKVRNSRPGKSNSKVRLSGDSSKNKRKKAYEEGYIDMNIDVYNNVKKFSESICTIYEKDKKMD